MKLYVCEAVDSKNLLTVARDGNKLFCQNHEQKN